MTGVRADAPWCPWNIEFIRRINGLDSVDDVHRIVFDAELPRARASATSTSARRSRRRSTRGTGWSPPSTTRRAPGRRRTRSASAAPTCASTAWRARAATSSSAAPCRCGTAVRSHGDVRAGTPWLLRFFDQIRWYPVSAEELLELRAEIRARPGPRPRSRTATFSLADYQRFLAANAESIAAFRPRQAAAFDAERERWQAAGEFDRSASEPVVAGRGDARVPAGAVRSRRRSPATVWQMPSTPGDAVAAGEPVLVAGGDEDGDRR